MSIAKMRTLIPDNAQIYPDENDVKQYIFTDDEIQEFLDIAEGSVLRGAAYAVGTMATSEAIISKVIRTQDLTTNGAAVSDTLLKRADSLHDRADKQDLAAGVDFFQIVYPDHMRRPPELTEWPNRW